MNLELVLKDIDSVVFAKVGRHLRDVEIVVLKGAWEAKTYEQMQDTCKYSLNYIKQAAAPRLWKLLSEILEEDISKTNFRFVVERRWQSQLEKVSTVSSLAVDIDRRQASPSRDIYQNASELPDINIFYGRTQELTTLEQWLVGDRCRIIAVAGVGGIGKTTLSIRCIQQVRDQFEFVVWRYLRSAITVNNLLADLKQIFSLPSQNDSIQNLDSKISNLIGHLRQHRCLIVLDTGSSILQNSLGGDNREGYQGYTQFLRRLAQESHQSCLMLIAREKPKEIALMEGAIYPVRSLYLRDLGSQAEGILKENNLLDTDKWKDLIQLYRGNPLALKIVASTIQELFGGKVSAFLRQETIVFGELNDILDEQFECISAMEQEIICWLAIACQPISLSQLRSDILVPINQAEFIEALRSLLRRSLIDRIVVEEEVMLSLQQPVLCQYVINKIVERICQEIQEVCKTQKIDKMELLRTLNLANNKQTDQKIKEIQVQVLLKPIKNRLCKIFQDESLIEAQLTKILSLLQGKTLLAVGYASSNLHHLLLELKLDTNASAIQRK
ncbi:NB-ARC domain-containing protein [Cylindrospermum sp. FACHB-282]|uniref:NB-ARC domain-containing protein n=1 Tax=Cylindrospermum sp. FACHB-282 TaxID=2692794 RepID=UPI0016889A3E|nr:NB-ARC domain-containing protein [Cylindrospermum sp. FACHB-282]MBD2387076.1 hypothetical protein [Cylindrospermum sp. FACHB-282]